MMTCLLCGDPVHTSEQHERWLEWHNAHLAGDLPSDSQEPPLERTSSIDRPDRLD